MIMKYIPFFLIIVIVYVFIARGISAYKIPDDAIRIRVIANSNSENDQKIKMKVKEQVEKDMYNLLKDTKGVANARHLIKDNLNLVNEDVDKVLKDNEYALGYDVNFGYNYFPSKKYKGITYDAGYYESLVVTLGSGKGDNWWCVLFPPFCLMEANESDKVEYTSMAQELVDKYL